MCLIAPRVNFFLVPPEGYCALWVFNLGPGNSCLDLMVDAIIPMCATACPTSTWFPKNEFSAHMLDFPPIINNWSQFSGYGSLKHFHHQAEQRPSQSSIPTTFWMFVADESVLCLNLKKLLIFRSFFSSCTTKITDRRYDTRIIQCRAY